MKSSNVLTKKNARGFEMPFPRPFTESGIVADEITVRTVQGLGDTLWVYQKLAPYFRRINFELCMVKDEPLQRRTVDWLPIFEQVGTVDAIVVSHREYIRMAHSFYRLQDAVDQWRGGSIFEYAVNAWLEEGVRLDEIDSGAEVQTDVKVNCSSVAATHEYLVLYVSESSTNPKLQNDPKLRLWTCDQWASFADQFLDRIGKHLPIVLIGANFDENALNAVSAALRPRRDVHILKGESPAMVAGTIKRAAYFIGYQSGLNIVADMLGTRQIMVYFDMLRPMLNTWCRREHIGTKFHAACFSDDPSELIDRAVKAWL